MSAYVSRTKRITRTAGQASAATGAVVIINWLATLIGLDLDPGEGNGLPVEVAAALQGLFTYAAAWWMNRPKTTTE